MCDRYVEHGGAPCYGQARFRTIHPHIKLGANI